MVNRAIIKGLKLKNRQGLDPQAIAEAIEQGFLAKRRPAKDWTQKVTFSPSTIAYGHGNCARFWFIAFEGTDSWQDDIDSMGTANMDLGSMVHDQIQQSLEAQGLLVEAEVEIKLEDPPVRGYLDAVINWEGEEVVGEIKTTRQESFAHKEMSGKPSVNHLIQLLIYMRATGRQRGFLLYVNKNDSTFLVIPVEMDETNTQILDNVLDWLKTTRAAWESKTLPLIPFTRARNTGEPSNKICRSCPVQKKCFENPTEGEVSIPLMEVPTL